MKTTIKNFTETLKQQGIDFIVNGNKITINGGYVDLSSLTTLPDNVQFNNGGYVDLSSLTTLPDNVQFNNGGYVNLSSLTTLPDNVQFNNGGYVYLKYKKIKIGTSYLKRFQIKIKSDCVILYKRVSKDFKTQEGTTNETYWRIGRIMEHPNWNPSKEECGGGKFHACAKPFWCDAFRNVTGDKYIAIKVNINDLYEWTNSPSYPQKIGFRKCKVMAEVKRTETYNL